jgi:hypothetical protein
LAFVGNAALSKIDVLGLAGYKDCDGNCSNSLDCVWTEPLTADRHVDASFAILVAHKTGNPSHPRVWWDDVCEEPRLLTKGQLISNPSGARNLELIGNSARSSLQSRYFWPAIAGVTVQVVVDLIIEARAEMGRNGSKAKFCCCKALN